MSEPVYIIGAARTDFKRHFQREGKTLRHIILEAGSAGTSVFHYQGAEKAVDLYLALADEVITRA